jgi:cytochrome c oxidase cbb3-type subunit III
MTLAAPIIRIVSILAVTVGAGIAQQAGQGLYQANCAGCHGLDGRGGEHAPNIATAQHVQQLADPDLLRTIRDGIPASGMPAFGSRLTSEQLIGLAHYLRGLQGERQTTAVPGDPEAGRSLFFNKAGCSECHMAEGKGGFIADDISSYAGTHSAEEARDAILNPDNNVDPHHAIATAVTRDGRRYTGIVRNEDSSSLQLQARDGSFYLLDKSTLAGITREKKSLMPSDYGSKLSPAELNNLISYLVKAAVTHPDQTGNNDEQ